MRTSLAPTVVSALERFEAMLVEHRARLDEMNVYPVPDGDTGSNLLATVAALRADAAGPDLASVASSVADAAVRAARGNSGIILAESLRAFTSTLADDDDAGIAGALAEAAAAARRAVGDPAEGTILTVAADAAGAAVVCEAAGGDDHAVLLAAREEAWASLARTPELLPALAAAGVVDAGGAGYALWLDALAAAAGAQTPRRALPAPAPTHDLPESAASLGARFELVVQLEAAPGDVEALRRTWAGTGDSIVVAGHGQRWRAHVHTDDPAAALAAAEALGTVGSSTTTDLHEQAAQHRWYAAEPAAPVPPGTGVVAVAASDELAHLFRELGAAQIVPGGRGQRPSGGALIEAIERTGSDAVAVLPNDGPTVDVARHALGRARRRGVVVATSSMIEGLAALRALTSLPPSGGPSAPEAMEQLLARTCFAEVLPVVRPAVVDGAQVHPGDWLVRGRPRSSLAAGDPLEACVLALDRLVEWIDGGTGDCLEALLVARGALGAPADSVALRAHIDSLYPGATVETYDTAEPNVAFALAAQRC